MLHKKNCPPKIDVYTKYTPKHKVWSLGQKIKPTKNQLAKIHQSTCFPNFFLDLVVVLGFPWFFQCFLDIQVFSPSFSTFFPQEFFQPPFCPTEPWNFLIFDAIHRERPNVPDPQVVRGAVLDGESLQLRFESSRKNRG